LVNVKADRDLRTIKKNLKPERAAAVLCGTLFLGRTAAPTGSSVRIWVGFFTHARRRLCGNSSVAALG